MAHALVIGEALVDVVRTADGTVTEHPGGSPANVALGLARLGRHTELATWLGPDARGELVASHLRASGVHLVPGSERAERTPTAMATLAQDGSATYEFDLAWRVPEVALDDTVAVLHTGSIAGTLEPGGSAVAEIAAAAREHATISYDPNARPTIMGSAEVARPVIERLVTLADIVKVSDEDIAWLYPGADDLEIIQQWVRSGPSVVVLTRGGAGSVGVRLTGGIVEVPAPSTTVVDTVGAGDSYMAGLLDGLWSAGMLGAGRRDALRLIDEETLRRAMTHAARIAAIVVSRAGANPPTTAELKEHA
ncbi:carbohydrate kinase [Ruania suaedae]|uniref:carbohydrate kinase family protein n=1 Tax=Ruania suaedae TaxID=2897774 RepID=UPI001E4E2BB1|nr:carbohydrate kinase [Ruania suaedae]UFU02321.1 carbohydrate kinase [Ruania suaedae]